MQTGVASFGCHAYTPSSPEQHARRGGPPRSSEGAPFVLPPAEEFSVVPSCPTPLLSPAFSAVVLVFISQTHVDVSTVGASSVDVEDVTVCLDVGFISHLVTVQIDEVPHTSVV